MKNLFKEMNIVIFMAMLCLLNSCENSDTQTKSKKEDVKQQTESETVIDKNKSKPQVVGVLTAYYAKEDFKAIRGTDIHIENGSYAFGMDKKCKKGELICDYNNPYNRIVDYDNEYYKYYGDAEMDGDYSYCLLPKSKVEKKEYLMCNLPITNVENGAYFKSDNGCNARIFKSDINGHKFCDWEGNEMGNETHKYSQCYVLSVEIGVNKLFEEPVEEKDGNLKIYFKNIYGTNDKRQSDWCRYREGPEIGYLEERWVNKAGYLGSSAYSTNGKLLVDQWEDEYYDFDPSTISIAYIADIDALYVNGVLYYRTKE